jgi:predicted metal-binding membrane protein
MDSFRRSFTSLREPAYSLSPILVAVLKRNRAIVAFGLAGITLLSWTYLIYMDWGMRHMDVGLDMVIMPAMQHWTAWDLVLVFLMWAVMMVAMMIPAASPVILLFAEINRRRNEQQGTLVATGQFLLGYLTAWTGFSALATLAQWGLLTAALVSPMMESTSKELGAGLLFTAGLFQLSRLKYACLVHCRSPMGFLATEWRRGPGGAFRMGLKHGGYCLGCCWALMGLLFAFGVMNLLWVAGLSAFVLLEKITPGGQLMSRLSGLLFIGWAAWMFFGS